MVGDKNMDIFKRMEEMPLSRFHWRLLFLTGFGWLFDAMDTGLVSFVMPLISKEWQLSSQELGWIGSVGLLGMALGAVIAGWAADRVGRRKLFMATLCVYSIATAACAFAPNKEVLLALRFLTGVGLGGQLPVAVTLVSEYAPAAERGKLVVLLESFWALGWLGASLASYFIIPVYGWSSAFLLGGLPIFYIGLLWRYLPESVRYLLAKGRGEEAKALVRQMETLAGLPSVELTVAQAGGAVPEGTLRALWQQRFFRSTLVLWIVWFGLVYSYYGMFTWLPTLMVQKGYPVVKTFEFMLLLTLAQIPGYGAAALLVDRLGRRGTLAAFLGGCAISAWLFSQAQGMTAIWCWGALMSFFNLGAWGVIYTYTPEVYPTRFRALGAGWAGAVGRCGGMLAPVSVGWLLSVGWQMSNLFFLFAAVLMGIALVLYLWGEETKGQRLAEE